MANSVTPRPYPAALRLLLASIAVAMIVGMFSLMTALSKPSQFVRAVQKVAQGPGQASDLQKLSVLDFNYHLYLLGPVISAAGQSSAPLFIPDSTPVLPPSTFTDASGVVEVLAHEVPLTAEPAGTYAFGETLHMLGWRTAGSQYSLFAVSKTHQGLLDLLQKRAANWKSFLFYRGLLLIGLVFVVFWLLNMSVLSTISLRPVQLLIVNLIFLVLYYSVLVLSAYPLLATLPQALMILMLANLVFVSLIWAFRPKSTNSAGAKKEQ